jgi:hypothetical protein
VPAPPSPTPGTAVIRSHWLRWLLRVVWPALAIGVLIDLYGSFADHRTWLGSVETIGLGLLLSLSVLTVGLALVAVRAVEISDSGVTFVSGFKRFHIAWSELSPPVYPLYVGGLSFVRKPHLPDERPSSYTANREQAVAILRHPKCPKFALSPEILTSLGLRPSLPPAES